MIAVPAARSSAPAPVPGIGVRPPAPQVALDAARAAGLPVSRDQGSLRLEPFPARGSAAEAVELATLHALQQHRTPDGVEWARQLDAKGGIPIWNSLVDDFTDRHGAIRGAAVKALTATSMAITGAMTGIAMVTRRRQRPYEVDPSITPAAPRVHAPSNPSGHTSAAYAAATILKATDDVTHGAAAFAEAEQMAASRLYAGMHFPSDVTAGARLGTGVANALLKLVPRSLRTD